MNELQRQAYIKALGVTPWVAAVPLPGAAETPLLEWPEVAAPAAAQLAPESEAASQVAPISLPTEPTRQAPVHQTAPIAEPQTERKASPSTQLTLQAHQVGDVWVIAEQEDASAPDLSREALQLLQNLLAIFPGQRKSVRKFLWPLSDVAMDDAALGKTFHSFTRGLGGKILLCVSEQSCSACLNAPRFALHSEDNSPAILPVSSLQEMLQNPVEQKRRTWQAMLATGFYASADKAAGRSA